MALANAWLPPTCSGGGWAVKRRQGTCTTAVLPPPRQSKLSGTGCLRAPHGAQLLSPPSEFGVARCLQTANVCERSQAHTLPEGGKGSRAPWAAATPTALCAQGSSTPAPPKQCLWFLTSLSQCVFFVRKVVTVTPHCCPITPHLHLCLLSHNTIFAFVNL